MTSKKILGVLALFFAIAVFMAAVEESGAQTTGSPAGPQTSPGKGGGSATESLAAASTQTASDPRSEEFTRRMIEAVERTKAYKVVYQDVLGEGDGQWDADPRYPTDSVNCIIWFQLLLSEVYGHTSEDKQAVMDRVRYFGGHTSFGFRKHYIDQWTALEPGPLQRVNFSSCPYNDQHPYHLDLQPLHFMESIHFPCPLYHSDQTSVDLTLESGPGVVQCGNSLAPGFYALFPVASDLYLSKYAGFSGPMAQVHFVLLEVPPKAAPGAPEVSRDPAKWRVWHASTGSGKVVETELGSYVLHMWELFRGYVVYKLDPNWDWRSAPPLDDEGKALVACEATVQGHAGPLFEENARKMKPAAAEKH